MLESLPREAQIILQLLLLLLAGWLLTFLFGHVRKGEKRRLLQNLVYRGYLLLNWVEAVWGGFDTGVGVYYQKRAAVKIRPRNERSFPMEKEKEKDTPSSEVPEVASI